jgi:integrase
MEKLTKRSVEALKPPSEGQAFLWDGEMRGFGVRVIPSGLKSFVLQYRTSTGRSRRIGLGRFGVLTVEQARKEAREKLVAVSKGADPAEESAASRAGKTIADLCDWYLAAAEEGRILGRKRRPIKPSTLAMDRSRIEQHIKPLLGKRKVRTLSLADIEGMQGDIAAGKTAKNRIGSRGGATTGGVGVASRTVSTLHSLLEHTMRLGEIGSNPARGVRRLATGSRERRLSISEIERLGFVMRAAPKHGEHPTGLAAVRLLLLTGYRRQEALGMHRDWLNPDQRYVRFPDTKSDGQVRVIGQAAVDFIQTLPVRGDSPYLLPADWGEGHFTAAVATLDRLCADAGLKDVTPHTLRHTFASVAGDLGFSELTIKALLGHAARGVTQRYVHIDEAVRMAADRVAGEIAALIDGATSHLSPPIRRAA